MFEDYYMPSFDYDYFSSPEFQQAMADAGTAPASVAGIGAPAVSAPAYAPSVIETAAPADLPAFGITPEQYAAVQQEMAGFDPSKINLAGLGRINLVGGTYDGETKAFTAPTSNKGNATSRINSKENLFEVTPLSTIRVVSGGEVLYEGSGYDGAAQAVQIAQKLSDENGNSASWDIAVNTPGISNSPNDFATVAREKVNLSTGQIAMGVLNAAVQIGVAVATSGMSLPAQAAISAGTSAAMTLAQGGSITDAIKAGVMAAAPVVGARELGKIVQSGVNAAGQTVATTLGSAIGAGASSTAAGLITGKSIEDALKSGVISAAGQVLAGELASKSPSEVADLVKAGDLSTGLMDTMDDISASLATQFAEAGLSTASLGANFASNLGSVAEGADRVVTAITGGANVPVAPTVSGIGGGAADTDIQRDIDVQAKAEQPGAVTEVPVAPSVVAGIGGGTQEVVPEAIITAKKAPEPAVETPPVVAPAAGIGTTSPETVVTAQRAAEPAVTEEAPVTPSGLQGDILVNAERAAEIREQPSVSPTLSGIGDLLESAEIQDRIDEEMNRPPEEKKSTFDKIKDAAQIAGAAATIIPLVGKAIGGGGGGGTSRPDTSGINFTKTTLRPTIPAGGIGGIGGVGGAGGRYPYTPTTYGRAGGDQETEYVFFTKDPLTGEESIQTGTPAAVVNPADVPAKKEGGEIHDDMVKHLVEYQKGGGHRGPGKVTGIGSGQEDLIPAWLSDGEYVWSAQDVADLGDGSTDEGVRRLDKMRQMVRRQAGRKNVKKIAKPQKGIDKMLKAVGGLA